MLYASRGSGGPLLPSRPGSNLESAEAGQLPKVFGFNVSAHTLLAEARGLVSGIADGRANRLVLTVAG